MKPEDIVLVHYAVSSFVGDAIITDGIRVAKEKGPMRRWQEVKIEIIVSCYRNRIHRL